jgi:glucan endo-1,3-beta-D-glucosidase
MKSSLVTVLGGASTALAAVKGFNYAAQGQNQASFEASFRKAAGLQGANDFTGARLYTMIQEGTTNSPIEAIPAAIDTNTTMLLGLWASSPQNLFDNEIDALKSAIQQYGSDFHGLVTGISVGSEDLYRISATGIANDPDGVGQTPDTLIDYIQQVRDALKGTPLEGTPVGHVDTWNAYVNGSNSKVIEACDFLGLDEYPYFQTTDPNAIENGQKLFFEAYDKVTAVAGGKPLWITEAGWPVSGKQSGAAIASVDNAETFWQEVACALEKKNINFWWYILEENADPSFAVSSNGKPLYNLACNATSGTIPSGSSNSTSGSSNSTSSGGSSGHGQGSGSSSSTGSSSSSSGSSSGSGSQSSGSSASSTGSSATASSTFDGAADKAQVGIFGLMLTAMVAIFAL